MCFTVAHHEQEPSFKKGSPGPEMPMYGLPPPPHTDLVGSARDRAGSQTGVRRARLCPLWCGVELHEGVLRSGARARTAPEPRKASARWARSRPGCCGGALTQHDK
uniref:Uncharacterized protein n=1 Tax=Mustela putorius furo TaxID=9669 RepID=M3Y3F2_MUSPF